MNLGVTSGEGCFLATHQASQPKAGLAPGVPDSGKTPRDWLVTSPKVEKIKSTGVGRQGRENRKLSGVPVRDSSYLADTSDVSG
jgi:hypothetical protein